MCPSARAINVQTMDFGATSAPMSHLMQMPPSLSCNQTTSLLRSLRDYGCTLTEGEKGAVRVVRHWF